MFVMEIGSGALEVQLIGVGGSRKARVEISQPSVVFEDDAGHFTGVERSAIRKVKVDGDRVTIVYSDGVEMKTKEFVASKGESQLFGALLSPNAPVNVIDALDQKFQEARRHVEEILKKVRERNFPPVLNIEDHDDPQYLAASREAYAYDMDLLNTSSSFSIEVEKMYAGGSRMPLLNAKDDVPEKVYMAMAKAHYVQFIADLASFAMIHNKWERIFLPRQFEEFHMKLGILREPIVTDEEEADAEKSYSSPEMVNDRAIGYSWYKRPPSLELLDC